MELPFGLNPYETDPGAWGASLLLSAELVLGCLDAAGARSVAEVGAYAGDLTRLLVLWAERCDATVLAIDPSPQPELEALAAERPGQLELRRQTSLEALAEIELPDAVIVDGDHNYYTVTRELELIYGRAESRRAPLVLTHDLSWPHARRDDYFDPQQIPEDARQPIVAEALLYPGIEGTHTGGMRYHWAAAREGGPRNGVLTAVEDFLADRADLRLALIPAFFGVGVIWPRDAPYAEALQSRLEPWDRHPLLERLERNRVLHLASSQVQLQLAMRAQERLARAEQLLDRMLGSRAFAAAELFLRVRQRGRPAFSRAQIRALLSRD